MVGPRRRARVRIGAEGEVAGRGRDHAMNQLRGRALRAAARPRCRATPRDVELVGDHVRLVGQPAQRSGEVLQAGCHEGPTAGPAHRSMRCRGLGIPRKRKRRRGVGIQPALRATEYQHPGMAWGARSWLPELAVEPRGGNGLVAHGHTRCASPADEAAGCDVRPQPR